MQSDFFRNPVDSILRSLYRAEPKAFESVDNEKASRDDPTWWLLDATALFAAAEALAALPVRAPKYDLPKLHGYSDARVRAASLMLLGMSLEVVIKAVFRFARLHRAKVLASEVSDVAIKKLLETHDLIALSGKLFNLNERQTIILGGLSQFIIWAGRYPSPKDSRAHVSICQLRAVAQLTPELSYEEMLGLVRELHVCCVKIMHEIVKI